MAVVSFVACPFLNIKIHTQIALDLKLNLDVFSFLLEQFYKTASLKLGGKLRTN